MPSSARPYYVVAAPFRQILLKAMERHPGEEAVTRVGLAVWGRDNEWSEHESWLALTDFLARDSKMIDFDLADKIVTRILGPVAWYGNPELSEIYRNVPLETLDVSRPCNDWIIPDLIEQVEDIGISEASELFGVSRYTARRAIDRHLEKTAELA